MPTSFLSIPHITNIGGFIGVFFQLSAALAGARALINKKTISIKQGRAILVINFGVSEENKPYGSNGAISNYRELYSGQEGGDTIIYFYHNSEGDISVNEALAKWGLDSNESRPTLRAPQGGEIPDDRWLSEWAANRHTFGCPAPEGIPYLSEPRKQDCLEASIKALSSRFQYDTLKLWGDRGTSVISYTYMSDDDGSAEKLCEFFENKSKDDYEKTCSIMALTHGSRVINIFKISNVVNHDLNNINVFIGGHGHRSGTVIESAAKIEGIEIINQAWQISHVRINTLPANATRFLLVQSNSPLSSKDISVESGLTNKFGVSTLRKIALTSFLITLVVLFVNLNIKNVPWEEKQLSELKSINKSITKISEKESIAIEEKLESIKSLINEKEPKLSDKLIKLKKANN